MKRLLLALTMLVLTVLPAGTCLGVELGSGTTGYRNQVIKVCGISDLENLNQPLTRQEFAKMVVMASSAKDTLGTASVTAAADVPAASEFAPYIRAALKNGWMRTKLGGVFDPAGIVTLNDAVKAGMALLGYADSDFQGNVNEARQAKFISLGLKDGVSAEGTYDPLTKQDAINILYNTLKTTMKTGNSICGASVGLTLASDGELNANGVIDTTMKGPFVARNMDQLQKMLPFTLAEAVCYYNGKITDYYTNLQLFRYTNQLDAAGWIIIYYNEASKNVWAYGSEGGGTGSTYLCEQGTVQAIYYESENIVSPSSVVVDGTTYPLSGSDIKFLFSPNGTLGIGDSVVLICKANAEGSFDDSETGYTAVGAVLLYKKGSKS